MTAHKNELLIPPTAASTAGAVEFIRVWKVDDGVHVSLNYSAWKQPEAWGLALADIVQHFADACEKSQGWPRQDIIDAVVNVFNAELEHPTDTPRGDFS